jgi:hypothetical protein
MNKPYRTYNDDRIAYLFSAGQMKALDRIRLRLASCRILGYEARHELAYQLEHVMYEADEQVAGPSA